MDNKESIQQKIVELESNLMDAQKELSDIQNEIDNFDASDYVTESEYDNMLDECCDTMRIGNLSYSPLHVLKNIDPIAYRCGYNDYIDSVDLDTIEEYRELVEQKDTLESEIDDIESELESLNDKLADIENEE